VNAPVSDPVAPDRTAGISAPGEARPARITIHAVFATGLRTLVDVDFASVRTFSHMRRRPGALARAYFAGDRALYVNPIKYAFWSATLYVLLNEITNTSEAVAFFDPLIAYRALWPYLALLLVLPGAAVLRALFRNRSWNAAECYAFGLFLFAQAVLFKTAELLLIRFSRVAVQHYRFSGLGG
jgi:hypothetical protein